MKFRCTRDVLSEALGVAGRAVASRSGAHPVLSGVRMDLAGEVLTVTGTDADDLTLRVQRQVTGQRDGSVVVPARLMSDLVRTLEDSAVELEAGEGDVHVAAGRSNFVVHALAVEDFPRIPAPAGDAVTLEAAQLAEALRQVVRAASTDEARPILTGVLLESEQGSLRLVATDSYRLAVRDLPGTDVLGERSRVLLPSRALNELARLLPGADAVRVHLGERDVTFDVGETHLTTRLLEGEFPNYRQLIPNAYPNRLTVGKSSFLDALRRAKVMANDTAANVRLSLSGERVELFAIDQERGEAREELEAKYEGNELTVAFNPDYLSAGVEAVLADEVTLETLDALKPAVLRGGESGEFLYLLMPVRFS